MVSVRAKVDRSTSKVARRESTKAHKKWVITRCQFGPVEIVFPGTLYGGDLSEHIRGKKRVGQNEGNLPVHGSFQALGLV